MSDEVFKIEKEVPIPPKPPKTKSGGRPRKYPFLLMEIGDSFSIPAEKIAAVSMAAYNCSKKYGRKFSTRRGEDGVSARCWRVA